MEEVNMSNNETISDFAKLKEGKQIETDKMFKIEILMSEILI